MHFAAPIPWWAAGLAAIAIAAIAFWSYRRPLAPLTGVQRWTLTALRALHARAGRRVSVPPGHPAAAGRRSRSRRARARRRVGQHAHCGCGRRHPAGARRRDPRARPRAGAVRIVHPRGLRGRRSWTAAQPGDLRAGARRSNLAEAIDGVRERYRGRRVPGIVLISDGATTGSADARRRRRSGVHDRRGVGRRTERSRSPVALSAGDPRIDQTSIDLRVVDRQPRLRPVAVSAAHPGQRPSARIAHRSRPPADGAPVEQVITVSPEAAVATVYTAEIEAADGEAVVENNARSVLVSPDGKKTQGAGARRRARLRLQLPVARARQGSRARIRFDRAEGSERGGPAHLPRAGRRRPRRGAHVGLPGDREALYGYDAADPRERRRRLPCPRAVRDGGGFRIGARRRADRAGRTLVRAARSDRHAARGGAAGRAQRSARRPCARRPADAEGAPCRTPSC